jgi:Tfp pilus assembly protein PilF
MATLSLGLGLTAACSGDEESADGDTPALGDPAVERLLTTGYEQLDAHRTPAARTTFENVLDLDADNVYAHYNLGLIAQAAGQEDAALAEYDAALAVAPEFASALYNKGILTEDEDLDAAVELYRNALESDPEMAAAQMRLGFALEHLGQQAEAQKHLAEGLRLDPAMADVTAPTYD